MTTDMDDDVSDEREKALQLAGECWVDAEAFHPELPVQLTVFESLFSYRLAHDPELRRERMLCPIASGPDGFRAPKATDELLDTFWMMPGGAELTKEDS